MSPINGLSEILTVHSHSKVKKLKTKNRVHSEQITLRKIVDGRRRLASWIVHVRQVNKKVDVNHAELSRTSLPPATKVMFLHLSFCSGGVSAIPPGQTHPSPWADTPRGQTPPTPCAVHAGIRSTSGWYASYWNAILF